MDLIEAAKRGDVEEVRRLLAEGADPDEEDESGVTAAMAAAGGGHRSVIETLRDAGADLTLEDDEERTAAHYAYESEHRDLGAWLDELVKEEKAPAGAIDRLPFPERRGVTDEHKDYQWHEHLVRGTLDEVIAALEARPEVGVVRRMEGLNFRQPDGRTLVLLQFEGTDWVHVSPSWSRDDLGQTLSEWTGRRVMEMGYRDFTGRTWLDIFDGGRKVLGMLSDGSHFPREEDEDEYDEDEEFDDEEEEEDEDADDLFPLPETPLQSELHPDDYWRTFGNEIELLQALVREQDAYVPLISVSGHPGNEICVDIPAPGGEDHIAGIAFAVLGDPSLADHNPATSELERAIYEAEPEAARAALDAGASLDVMPSRQELSAVGFATQLHDANREGWLATLRLVAERAPDVDYGGDVPTALVPFEGLFAVAEPVISAYEALRPYGLDLQVTDQHGRTPLHHAAQRRLVPVVQYLHAMGVDPNRRDAEGKTARDLVQPKGKPSRKDADTDKALAAMERGDPAPDLGKLLKRIERAASVQRESRRKAGASLKEALGAFGKAMEKVNDPDATEESLLEVAATISAFQMPPRIHVQRLDEAPPTEAQRAAYTRALAAAGFERIGAFGVREFPEYRMDAWFHAGRRVYGVACEQKGQRWLDVACFRADGTMLTVTDVETMEAAHQEVPGQEKVRLSGATPEVLIARAFADEADPADVTADDFARGFEDAYAQEMAARRSR